MGVIEVMPYGTEDCLFDVEGKVTRIISLKRLDEIVDTEEDWIKFVFSLNNVNYLVIEKGNESINPIISSYRNATLQAYCYRLRECGIKVMFKSIHL